MLQWPHTCQIWIGNTTHCLSSTCIHQCQWSIPSLLIRSCWAKTPWTHSDHTNLQHKIFLKVMVMLGLPTISCLWCACGVQSKWLGLIPSSKYRMCQAPKRTPLWSLSADDFGCCPLQFRCITLTLDAALYNSDASPWLWMPPFTIQMHCLDFHPSNPCSACSSVF